MYGNNNNPYVRPFNNMISQQSMYEQIDNEINNLQQMKERMKNNQLQQNQPQQQPTSINQTFQLAPANRDVIRYANSYEEVQREMVMGDTPFFSKDMSVVWVKNTKGEIKSYELNEIVEKDAKDIQIDFLTQKIKELEGMIKNDTTSTNVTNVNAEQVTTNTTTNDGTNGEPIEEIKPTSIQRVPTSKKK